MCAPKRCVGCFDTPEQDTSVRERGEYCDMCWDKIFECEACENKAQYCSAHAITECSACSEQAVYCEEHARDHIDISCGNCGSDYQIQALCESCKISDVMDGHECESYDECDTCSRRATKRYCDNHHVRGHATCSEEGTHCTGDAPYTYCENCMTDYKQSMEGWFTSTVAFKELLHEAVQEELAKRGIQVGVQVNNEANQIAIDGMEFHF